MEFQFASRYEGVTGSAIRAIFSLLKDPQIISFAGGNPSPLTFPSAELAKIAEELVARRGASVLQYGGTDGTAELKDVVAELLRAEGFAPKPEELIILSGSSQGIDLMAKAMINPGDVALVESPTFLGAIQTFRLMEAEIVEVEMDEHGIIMDDLKAKLAQYAPKFLYTIPTFQNPSGRTLPAARREQMVSLCRAAGTLILEDDPYGALRYAGDPQPSIKSFDTDGIVVKLMSFSKTISPGLRVGAAYGHADIIKKFNLGKQGQDVHTSNLNQDMVAEYIRRGLFPGHVRENCALYTGKLDLMYDLAKAHFPEGTRLVKPQGGMFLWAELPAGLDATALFEEAVARKVAYVPGTHFYAGGGRHNTMRLNFTMVDNARIEQGMEILGKLLCEKRQGE